MQSKPLALAFSGGLDTSYCVPRLTEAGWSVHTVYVNTGGSSASEREAIRQQAEQVGAAEHHESGDKDKHGAEHPSATPVGTPARFFPSPTP